MKRMKRLTALLLCAACVCTLVCVSPAGAAEAVSTFPDITDPQVGQAVETLRTMGVIDGSGGRFSPDDSLTRAQFCKMAIEIMGKGDEASAQASRTIFSDVPGNHWARGYVNLAAATTVGGGEEEKGGSRLMMGLGNGSFAPDRAVTYGEAVTAVLRILGYTKEANANWPYGAVAAASAIELDSGFIPPVAGDNITRAQAALLFSNMLTAPVSGSKEIYAVAQGCSVQKDAVLLACNTTTASGVDGAVQLFTAEKGPGDPILAEARTPASFFQGLQGSAVLNKDGRFVTFLPDRDSKMNTFTTASATNRVLTASNGTKLSLLPTTKVWYNGEEKTYADIYSELNREGVSVTVSYGANGSVSGLYANYTTVNSAKDGALVAKEPVVGNPFGALTRGYKDYKIVKNGVEITASGLRQYDVGAFHKESNTLYVSDFRLTCMYVDAQPNRTTPTSITISAKLDGKDTLDVLDCAVADLAACKVGEPVTLLFSADGKVAGAVPSDALHSNALGYVDTAKFSADSVTVNLLNAPFATISGKPGSTSSELKTTLVAVNAASARTLGLTRQSGNKSGTLDLDAKTLGKYTLASNVNFFERVGSGEMAKIKRSDITVETIPEEKVVYRHMDYAGQVDAVILNDVTGDRYTYGIVSTDASEVQSGSVPDTTKPIWVKGDPNPKPVYEKGTEPFSIAAGCLWDANMRKVDSDHYLIDEVGNRIQVMQNGIPVYESDVVDSDGNKLDENGNKMQETDTDGNPKYEMIPVTTNKYTTNVTKSGNVTLTVAGGNTFKKNQFVGVVASATNFSEDKVPRSTGSIALKQVEKVTTANFNLETNHFYSGNLEMPIWEGVQCYNAQTKTWFSGKDKSNLELLRDCLAYSTKLTVYYDRDPNQGGKVRIVVAN